MLPQIAMEGTVVADPELRFSPSGVAVGSFRMAANSRKKNEAGEWVNDKTLWMRVVCFKQLAENAAESLRKGDLAVVTGRIYTNEWEDEQGQKRSSVELVADTVNVSLAFRTVPHGAGRAERSSASPSAPPDDPWASGAQPEEPPF